MTKREILQTIQLRQSTIKDYLNCPLMFRFKHLDKIPPEFRNPAALHGSILHKLLYLIHESKWNMEVSHYYREIFDEFEHNQGFESNIPVRWEDRDKELAAFEQNAIEILDGYRRKPENREAIILYAEQPFRVKLAGQIFTGTIDQVRRNSDSSIELLDYKSGKQQPNPIAIRNDWQLSLYQYALQYGEFEIAGNWLKPGLKADFSSIYFLRAHEVRKKSSPNGPVGSEKGDPLIRTKRSPDDLRRFKKQMEYLLKAMLRDCYFPNPNHCHMCQYTDHCLDRSKELPANLIIQARQRLKEAQVA